MKRAVTQSELPRLRIVKVLNVGGEDICMQRKEWVQTKPEESSNREECKFAICIFVNF